MARLHAFSALSLLVVLPGSVFAQDAVKYSEPVGVNAEAEWGALSEELKELVSKSTKVVRGEILTTREDVAGFGPVTVVAVVVGEVFRGDIPAGGVIEVAVPLQGPVSGERAPISAPVRGYDVVLFLDGRGDLVDRGLFLVEGGFAWRPNRPGVMLSPRLQQDWDASIDPIGDYDVFSLDTMRRETGVQDEETSKRRRRRRK